MSMQSHLAELERRHKALEKEIETEFVRKSADGVRIAELKRKKLSLKDEITRLKDPPDPTMH